MNDDIPDGDFYSYTSSGWVPEWVWITLLGIGVPSAIFYLAWRLAS